MRREEHREIELLERIARNVEAILAVLLTKPSATTAVLSIGGTTMSTAVLTFTDATGASAAPPNGDGSGLVVTFASDNANVTVGAATASGDTATAAITGTEAFNLSATVANTSGAELFDNDGTTAFVQPSPIAVPASTPQAVTATLSVTP
jgi:hypothetical protein